MKKTIVCIILSIVMAVILILPATVQSFDRSAEILPPGLYASAPISAASDRELTLSAVLASASDADVSLFYKLDTEEYVKLSATPNEATKQTYKYQSSDLTMLVYSATIPAAELRSGRVLTYYFSAGELKTSEKTVPVKKDAGLPELMISEICANPKGNDSNTYIELVNISDRAVDLCDYKLAYSSVIGGTAARQFNISDVSGRYVVEPGEAAVIWFKNATAYKTYATPMIDHFIAKCKTDGLNIPENTLVVPVDTTALIGGARVDSAKYFTLLPTELMQIYLVPKNEYTTSAISAAVINADSRSVASDGYSNFFSLKRDGENDVLLAGTAAPTPGVADATTQTLPNLTDNRPPAAAFCPEMANTRDFILYVSEESRVDEAVLVYKTDNMDVPAEMELTALPNGFYSATLPDTVLEFSNTISYHFRIADGSMTVIAEGEDDIAVVDNSGPRVLSSTPENYYYYEDMYTPRFSATYTDRNGIYSYSLKLDDTDITDKTRWYDGGVEFGGSVKVESGEHRFTLRLVDNSSNRNVTELVTVVYCGDASEMNLYRGELHAHTSYSDGKLTPDVAYDYARYVGGVDFFAVTDHSDSLTKAEWDDIIATALEKNAPGEYAALWGFEQTYNSSTGWYGHLNAINTEDYSLRSLPLRQFYAYLAERSGSIGQFNHPGTKWGNFCDYGFWAPEYDEYVRLYEMKGSGYDYEYMLCLNRGWHVGPAHNEDNHEANWTTANEATTYVLSPTLTRENILEALEKNRSYSTTDGTLKLYYKINNEWMGSKLKGPQKLNVSIELSTEKSTGLGVVNLMGEDNTVVATKNFGNQKSGSWKFSIDPNYEYYYVRVVQGSYYTVTAPIWVEERDALEIISIDTALLTDGGSEANLVTATVKNVGSVVMKNVNITFYQGQSATHYLATTPIYTSDDTKTLAIGELKPGETAKVEIRFSGANGKRRITALVNGNDAAGHSFGDAKTMLLSPVYITEVVASSASGNYDYVELYNNTNSTLALSGYYLRVWPSVGSSAKTASLSSFSIPARSSIVIWLKASTNTLTPANFNTFYGTSLDSSRLKIITTFGALADATQQIDIYAPSSTGSISSSNNILSRVEYNLGESFGKDLNRGKSIRYNYSKDISASMTKISSISLPTPGKVFVDQVPATRASSSINTISSAASGVYNAADAVKKAEPVYEVIGAYGDIPPTGDDSASPMIYVAIMCVSVIAIVAVILIIKKKRTKKEL